MSISGFGGAVVSSGYGSSLSQWRVLNATMERQQALVRNDAQNKADAEYARQKLPAIGSADELLKDRRLYVYVMRAFGLEDQVNSQALVKKILQSDLSDSNSYANRIRDTRFRELAGALNFGSASSEPKSFIEQISSAYVTRTYEEQVGSKNPALSMMLDYTRNLASKNSWAEVLADKEMAEIVRMAFNLPEPYGPVGEAKQAEELEGNIVFSRYKSGAELQKTVREAFFDTWDALEKPRGSSIPSKNQWDMLTRSYSIEKRNIENSWSVKKDIAYLDQKIPNLRSVDDVLKDKKLLPIILKSFDLEEKANDISYLRKVLESDPGDANSFAVKAGDKEKALASAFGSVNTGAKRRGSIASINDIIKRYETASFEVSAGNSNEALRLGLYFERKASSMTSWYHVLADKAAAEVVRTALGLPEQIAQADLDRQAALLESRFDIKKLQDPAEVKKLVEKFMLMWDVNGNNSSNIASGSAALQMLSGAGRTTIDSSILMALATTRRF